MIGIRTLLITACLLGLAFGKEASARPAYGTPSHNLAAGEIVSVNAEAAGTDISYQDGGYGIEDGEGALGRHRFAVMVSRHSNQRDALKRHKDYLKQHPFLFHHRGAIVRDRFGLWHVIYGAFQSHAEARQACMALEQEKCLVQNF